MPRAAASQSASQPPAGVSPRTQFRELLILILLAVAAGLLWVFVQLAGDVALGQQHTFDERIILALRNPADPADPLGPEWLEELMRDFTALGGTGVLVFLTAAAAVFLLLERRPRTVVLLLVAIGGGVLLSSLLKHGFSRPRPELVPHGSYVYTSSFPSGHSMMSAIAYLTLAALLASTQRRVRIRVFLLTVAVILTLLVGFSRVYLGVHWPTDVLAGWTLGAAWAIICCLADRWIPSGREPRSDV